MRKKGNRSNGEPKRPLNSFMEFFQEERLKILSEASSISTIEISKMISQRWKNMNADEKDHYTQRYKVKLLSYKEQVKEFKIHSKNTSGIFKNGPKHPLNPYLEFAHTERPKILAEQGKLSLSDVGRELGKRWSKLTSAEKSVYEEKSKENRVAYLREKAMVPFSTDDSDSIQIKSHTASSEFECTSQSAVSLQKDCREEENCTSELSLSKIDLEDLGFAKQTGYDWHPAIKIAEIARGTRFKVTFFGTGDSCFVNQSDWAQYSEQTKSKVIFSFFSNMSMVRLNE